MSYQSIGERLAHARKARGLSQTDLAVACGMAPTQVSRYESGRAEPRGVTVAKFASALAVRQTWLLTGDGPRDEYDGHVADSGLTFKLDAAMSARLRNYANYSGLSITDALTEILDMPLSVFSDELLAKSTAQRLEIRPVTSRDLRLSALGGRVTLVGGDTKTKASSRAKLRKLSDGPSQVQEPLLGDDAPVVGDDDYPPSKP